MSKVKVKETLLFWKEQDPTINSMYLRSNVKELDDQERAEIISYLPDLQGKNILDLGAGIGRFTRHFATKASHVTSVDMAPQLIEKNRQDHVDCTNVTFLCSDAMNLRMKSGSLDFIFLNWLFMYLEDKEVELLLQRIYRWLKPQGEMFFRESCDLVRSKSPKKGYHVHYRPLSYYDSLIKKKFTLLKEGHIHAHIYFFADPFQCYWHCRKNH